MAAGIEKAAGVDQRLFGLKAELVFKLPGLDSQANFL